MPATMKPLSALAIRGRANEAPKMSAEPIKNKNFLFSLNLKFRANFADDALFDKRP